MSTGWLFPPVMWLLWAAWRAAYPGVNVRLEWKPADLWIGAYWEYRACFCDNPCCANNRMHLWVCLLPMLPIHFDWEKKS